MVLRLSSGRHVSQATRFSHTKLREEEKPELRNAVVYHHENRKGDTMFHPHLLDLFFGNHNALADTMLLVSAFKVEKELEDGCERRERANCPADKNDPYEVKPEVFDW
jgi:hypothetical protein